LCACGGGVLSLVQGQEAESVLSCCSPAPVEQEAPCDEECVCNLTEEAWLLPELRVLLLGCAEDVASGGDAPLALWREHSDFSARLVLLPGDAPPLIERSSPRCVQTQYGVYQL